MSIYEYVKQQRSLRLEKLGLGLNSTILESTLKLEILVDYLHNARLLSKDIENFKKVYNRIN